MGDSNAEIKGLASPTYATPQSGSASPMKGLAE